MYLYHGGHFGFGEPPAKQRCLIFFGYSGLDTAKDTGLVERDDSFHLVAQTLKEHLRIRFPTDDIQVICAWHKNVFLKHLQPPPAGEPQLPKIRQLHYVGHGGAGSLSFGYQNKVAVEARAKLSKALRKPPLRTLSGMGKRALVLSSDSGLLTGFFDILNAATLAAIKGQFTEETLMQVWGCFSGAPEHIFDLLPYWRHLNAAGVPMDGVARHIARSLGIKATAVYEPEFIHGMDFCFRDKSGTILCPDTRPSTLPHWLWPTHKSIRWVTYDASGTGDEKNINFMGKIIPATTIPGGKPPAWLTKEIPLTLKPKPPAFPTCSPVP